MTKKNPEMLSTSTARGCEVTWSVYARSKPSVIRQTGRSTLSAASPYI